MALHTNVGLGDFILMDTINMDEFVKNLKIRCGFLKLSFNIVELLVRVKVQGRAQNIQSGQNYSPLRGIDLE